MNYLQDERVLILGLGVSGLAMARWCARCGAFVRVADTRLNPPGLSAVAKLTSAINFVSGVFTSALLDGGITRVLQSPGLSPQDKGVQAVLLRAQELGIPVQGELELFSQALEVIDAEKRAQEEIVLEKALQDQSMTRSVLSSAALIENADGDDVQVVNTDQTDASYDFDDWDDTVALEGGIKAQEKSLPVVMGYQPKVIAITGTNGKTTVTSLTALLVKRSGKSVIAAGNIGLAMMDALNDCLEKNVFPQVWVLELSSFQLEGVKAFNPTASTILNVTQDHLDWHGDMQHYLAAKACIFGTSTVRVLNRNSAEVMNFLPEVPLLLEKESKSKCSAKVHLESYLTFGCDMPSRVGDFGLVEQEDVYWLARAQEPSETSFSKGLQMNLLMPVEQLRIRGRHNASNALAALALASVVGCDIGPMLQALREYQGEPHRVESVGVINGVEYIDDSKGTNVGATVAAIAGLGEEHRIVLILGGQGKGQDFSPLVPMVKKYVKAVVLIGAEAKLIEAALKEAGVALIHANTILEAVSLCAQQAEKGDVVLLSPACASLDMFKDYKQRAQAFVEAVMARAGGSQ